MISGPGKRLPALLLGTALLLVALATTVGSAWAVAAPGARTVHYAGRAVHVPAGFRVIRVAPHSRTCVRLDRRVVYLGGLGDRPASKHLRSRHETALAQASRNSGSNARVMQLGGRLSW